MCFTEVEWKFPNYKHHKVNSFYGLPNIDKSKVIESIINTETVKPLKFLNQMN